MQALKRPSSAYLQTLPAIPLLLLARMNALSGKMWNTPALAGKELFLRNHKETMCLELPLAKK